MKGLGVHAHVASTCHYIDKSMEWLLDTDAVHRCQIHPVAALRKDESSKSLQLKEAECSESEAAPPKVQAPCQSFCDEGCYASPAKGKLCWAVVTERKRGQQCSEVG